MTRFVTCGILSIGTKLYVRCLNVKNRVKDCRLKAHLSQDELAKACGLARPTISKIERDECEPSDLSKQKIADALNFPIDEVFPGTETGLLSVFKEKAKEAILGICIINGEKLVPGLRGDGPNTEVVEVKDSKIEGFLIDKLGKRKSFVPVHLIKDGEKVESTVTGRQGRFVFKNLVPGEYVVFSEDKITPVEVNTSEDPFKFDL